MHGLFTVLVVVDVVVCSVDKVLVVVVVVVCSVDKVLVENIKLASLESYMYSRGHDYTTMTLPHLAHTFDLPTAIVRGMWACGLVCGHVGMYVCMWACGHVFMLACWHVCEVWDQPVWLYHAMRRTVRGCFCVRTRALDGRSAVCPRPPMFPERLFCVLAAPPRQASCLT